MKKLLLDIETAPNIAHVWGLWDQTIGLNQLLASGYVLCWSAKWHGKKRILFDSVQESKPKVMLRRIHQLIHDADVVIHYNGKKFDMPTLNKEFLLYDMTPPSPVKQIDLCNVARARFRFPSNKLEYVAKALGVTPKVTQRKFAGHTLWTECMNGNASAWREMKKYNCGDVITLEDVYDKMLPWIPSHPNHGLYGAKLKAVCPSCGSENVMRRGITRLKTNAYARFSCKDCGSWSRSPVADASKRLNPVLRTDLG